MRVQVGKSDYVILNHVFIDIHTHEVFTTNLE